MNPRHTTHGPEAEGEFDFERFASLAAEGETMPLESVDPAWFIPPNIDGLADLPRIWFDWFLNSKDPVGDVDWQTYDDWVLAKRVRPGTRLFYSTVRAREATRRPGWLLVKEPPLYGAHKLQGFPRALRSNETVQDLTDLDWEPYALGEEGTWAKGPDLRQSAPIGRPMLRDVWPNVLAIDYKYGYLLALPYSSHVIHSDNPEDAEGLAPYPLHLPTRGVPVVDLHLREHYWEWGSYPLNDGSFWLFTIDGTVETQTDLAFNLDQQVSHSGRIKYLRRVCGFGATTALVVLRKQLPKQGIPGTYVVLVCQYPDYILYATRQSGSRLDKKTLGRCRRLLATVLSKALPGVSARDIARRPPALAQGHKAETMSGFKRSVICALEDFSRQQSKHRVDRFSGPRIGEGGAVRAASMLLRDNQQAQQAVRLLAIGWDNDQFRSAAAFYQGDRKSVV